MTVKTHTQDIYIGVVMIELDCRFTRENRYFQFRVGAIIIENGCVLLASNANSHCLYSIGGGVHMGETAEDAVLREVYEETGVRYEIDCLTVIHENFFREKFGKMAGYDFHEVCLYFLMKPRGTQELRSNSATRFGDKEQMHWIPINELGNYRAFPSFLSDYLKRSHTGIEHIITEEPMHI